ncbi:MAG: hypothetical protein KAY59_05685 [Acidobacteria bacterium]|nr:hypothetical protein [Acidobacteriota bacterium]
MTDQKVFFREASLSGELHHLAPVATVSSTPCGFSQPIWLLMTGAVFLLMSLLSAVGSRDGGATLFGGVIIAGICGLIFALQKKIVITIETTGGLVMGLAFKPSAMEQVSINLARALQAVDRLNGIVVSSHDSARTP